LLVEDATLIKNDRGITVHVRFKGGATRTLSLPRPLPASEARKTKDHVVAAVDRLLDHHTEAEIAALLNRRDYLSGTGATFTTRAVARIRCAYDLKTRYDRLREAGMLTADEIAEKLAVCRETVKTWRRQGLLRAHPYNTRTGYLYEPLDDRRPTKMQGRKLSERRRFPPVLSQGNNQVQHEA